MPNYEYECGTCGGRFEVIQKFSDPILTECRLCHAATVHKVLSPAAFVLKGTGWYATDYASKSRKEEKPADAACSETKTTSGCASGACAGGCAAKG